MKARTVPSSQLLEYMERRLPFSRNCYRSMRRLEKLGLNLQVDRIKGEIYNFGQSELLVCLDVMTRLSRAKEIGKALLSLAYLTHSQIHQVVYDVAMLLVDGTAVDNALKNKALIVYGPIRN